MLLEAELPGIADDGEVVAGPIGVEGVEKMLKIAVNLGGEVGGKAGERCGRVGIRRACVYGR